MLIALAGTVFPAFAAAQVSTLTGASANNPVNWCAGNNWFPSGIHADGSLINMPEGQLVSMFECVSVPTRMLTQIGQTEVIIRFARAGDFSADGAADPDGLADYITAFFAGCD